MTGMKIKNLPAQDNHSISVSTDIQAVLPDIMVKYLLELALREDRQTVEKQLFVLEAGELSGRSVQDIYHFCDNGNLSDRRRVYGIEPVNCKIQVIKSQNLCQMQLCV